jgi:hypothetical protein
LYFLQKDQLKPKKPVQQRFLNYYYSLFNYF